MLESIAVVIGERARMRILVVEDEPLLGDGIQVGLSQDGHSVDWVRSAEHAAHALTMAVFDLVVLDLGLPGQDGLGLLAEIRRAGNATPVIILTARNAATDRVRGLDLGADDYLAKPFDLGELCARVRAVSRRARGRAEPVLRAGDIELDPATHRVSRAGAPVELQPREFALLRILMEDAGTVVPKPRLQEALYGWSADVASNALEVHVHNLRRKFGAGRIRTLRGVGYALERE